MLRATLLLLILPCAATVAAAQQGTSSAGSHVLIGMGVGQRENPWQAFTGGKNVTAAVLMLSRHSGSAKAFAFEPEVGFWQEKNVKFSDASDSPFDVTTRVIHAGLNTLLRIDAGVLQPRIGVGVGLYYHNDAGKPALSEFLAGGNVQIGVEAALSPRLGAFAMARKEGIGTMSVSRAYGGVVLRTSRTH